MKTEVLKNFIVLEGLDGAGTTTQLNSLTAKLIEDNLTVFKTFEPTDQNIGRLIRSVLQKKISLEAKTISKLFVADRYEHIYGKDGIIEHLDNGEYVICDRYLFSSLAYQSPDCDFDFVYNINKDYPLPEYLFFISTPVEVCQERLDKRGDEKELFDAKEFQKQVVSFYNKALEIYKDSGINIQIIDGNKSPNDITNEILNIIR
ncbi:dTMP kinase [Thiospirochaeta perfilievii]|uniref:Thymidylate kinase n=1 Tax=Thiospirochaeta perfilievii TaxID=252967 RepID=A0A5C1Q5E0_9SPIO|nr:dTMP kinase [Thiospirochaeta perfilievii]QEN03273.1 dTMP kinase [Thiospirochaeta perfilievii]